ncbi:hypothetical protein [Winogradskyella arenosi]|uniref:Uncharacterized protein n=1 Tax=Winogradskyella arenosi TaxID=533325 RepID=A0A368ZIA4_9FLAO|nr:hypothetical protein [Winogradskyella arenosi]RCW92579.1 hypothetical protein DFQ08_102610 [Winogradskyella arenosi]
MRHTIAIFILIIFGTISCQGPKSKRQALSESITEFKNNVTLEKQVFIPKAYIEREVDTLLHNGYRVKIKTYADMSQSVLISKIKDTVNYQTHYRNFNFDIRVEKEGQLIYEEHFNKAKANALLGYRDNYAADSPFYNFHSLGVLQSIQVDDEPALKDEVLIDVVYSIPETDRFAQHTLFINEDGNLQMVHVTQN